MIYHNLTRGLSGFNHLISQVFSCIHVEEDCVILYSNIMDVYDVLGTIGLICLVILLIILIWWLWRRACREKEFNTRSERSTVLTTDEESQLNATVSEQSPINTSPTPATLNIYGSETSSAGFGEVSNINELPPFYDKFKKREDEDVFFVKDEFNGTVSETSEVFNNHLQEDARPNGTVKSSSLEEQKDASPLNSVNVIPPRPDLIENDNASEDVHMDDVIEDLPPQSDDNLKYSSEEIQNKLKELEEIERTAIDWAKEIPEALKDRRHYLHVREMLLRGIDAVDLTYANGVDEIKIEKRRILTYIDNQVDELESKKPPEF